VLVALVVPRQAPRADRREQTQQLSVSPPTLGRVAVEPIPMAQNLMVEVGATEAAREVEQSPPEPQEQARTSMAGLRFRGQRASELVVVVPVKEVLVVMDHPALGGRRVQALLRQ